MDNTVGSLTQFQKSVILGSLLGDGYLRQIKGRKDAFLEINHSYKANEYVDWKYEILKNITVSQPKARKGNGNRIAYRFYTRQMPELTEFLNLFYDNGKKIVPDIKLNPVILSIWYMNDGSKCGKDNYYLNTQQFDLENQKELIAMLKQDLGLIVTANKDKNYLRLRFIKSSITRLRNLIWEYIIPSMKYKIEQ